MATKLLIHAWRVEKKDGHYYLPFSHWIYLKEIVKYYDEVVLIAGCKHLTSGQHSADIAITGLGNISVHELPMGSGSYISSVKYFPAFVNAYRNIKGVSTYYSRYPTPFGWLQKVFAKHTPRIIHYVGDPADAAINNPNFSALKKKLLTSAFALENGLYSWACKGATVYTNGQHLAARLAKADIIATPLISSTLTDSDFYYQDKTLDPETAHFIYLGYLRTAKGVETVLQAFALYNKKYPNSAFTVIGSGEFAGQLEAMVHDQQINNVHFLGKIEEREKINQALRAADIFLFASLSEGSPRVVLEAMANGLAVISTPVGSLPDVFNDQEDIAFANFNDPADFYKKMLHLTNNNSVYNNLRSASYSKVKSFTIESFIEKIFTNNDAVLNSEKQ